MWEEYEPGRVYEQERRYGRAERRKEGIALAEEIEVKYRREGKFFDEILKGE